MGETFSMPLGRDGVAAAFAATLTLAIFSLLELAPVSSPRAQRCEDAASFLSDRPSTIAPVQSAEHGKQWAVSDGTDTVWLGAHGDELIEISFQEDATAAALTTVKPCPSP